LKYRQENFTSTNNECGNISLLGATLTSILSLFLLFLVLKMQVEYREAQYRKKSYLCFKYLVTQTEDYVALMTKFNWALRSAYTAQFSGAGTKEAQAIFKGLVAFRNTRHISYMKNLLTNKYCSFPASADFVKNLPYQTKSIFILKTAIDETVKVRANKWKNTVAIIPKQIRALHIFWLIANFSLDGEFLPNFQYSSKEVGKKALLSSNP
jgi:hypothetical protein